jgi:NAD(P)H-dependent flavin oxidoreductase YrpB (nitropropane dioxygenase family)
MSWNTRFTREYGLELPFVGAGMAMLAGPELVAAISEAGGLGVLGTGPLPPALLRRQIEQIRERTLLPFGVNLIVADTQFGPASTPAHIDVCIAERVSPIVFFWELPPAEWLARLHSAGIKVWATVSSVAEAREAAARGYDALMVQGSEAGGHVRATQSLLTLVPSVRDAIGDLPLIAAGGIADGRGAAAALVLGADAICMGTRLIATPECLAREDYKTRILDSTADQTTVTELFGPEWPDVPMRVLRNRTVEEGGGARPGESIGATTVFGQSYVLPHHSALLPTRNTTGDLDAMCLAAGASVGLVHRITPAAQLAREVMSEARALLG